LLLGATEQTQPAILDPASYIYDDKGRKKESIRAVELHQDTTQRDLKKNVETQKTVNTENQRKLAEQQEQLDAWNVWGDELTRPQNTQPRPPNTIGGRPDTRAAEATRVTIDPIRIPLEGDQAADEAPITMAKHREMRPTTRARLSVTTVVVRDT